MGRSDYLRVPADGARTRFYALVDADERAAFGRLCRRAHVTMEQAIGAYVHRAVTRGNVRP